jgi:rare lipoprotein A (peptidoglycan hydrolase)
VAGGIGAAVYGGNVLEGMGYGALGGGILGGMMGAIGYYGRGLESNAYDFGASSTNTMDTANMFAGPVTRTPGVEVQGKASFYSDWFNGRKTASGEIFSQDLTTGAMHFDRWGFKIPCDATVENLSKPSIALKVTINDHGPFMHGSGGSMDRPGFAIDLSKSAFDALGGRRTETAGEIAGVKVRIPQSCY